MSSTNQGLSLHLLGVGLCAPGLPNWGTARAVLAGEQPFVMAPTVVAPPQRLPATERRRAGVIIRVSINAADEALIASGLDAAQVSTVFSASEGDGKNCHDLCEALATPERVVSPTRFTNSVHNAAAGYWHIATHSMMASTSLCAHDASFAAGLMEAAAQIQASSQPVLLVVADQPYPEPIHAKRPLIDAMGVGLMLSSATSAPSANSLGVLTCRYASGARGVNASTNCDDAALESLRLALPAARGLPLLIAVARGKPCTVMLDAFDDLGVEVTWTPAR
jgi:hypothetical protein